MTSQRNEKVLVCGDVRGNFDKVFKKANQIHKQNGPFSMLLCVGEFFSPDNNEQVLKNLRFKPDLPVFVLGASQQSTKKFYPDVEGGELSDNIIYLGPSGVYPCASGLKITYISGTESANSTSGVSILAQDIKTLIASIDNKVEVDILITSQWPEAVWNYTTKPNGVDNMASSELLSYLAYKIKPRYHFCGSAGIHWERLPYRNHKVLQEKACPVTRFIGLSDVNNNQKLKWLYAFNITPSMHMNPSELNKQPDDVTENPYPEELILRQMKRLTKEDKNSGKQFFYDIEAGPEVKRKYRGDGDDGKAKQHKPAGPCWFCLSSPEVEKHLIISVGTHCYLALAKGGLVASHLLILPIEHFQSTPDLQQEALDEIQKFKQCLNKMYSDHGEFPVYFERNYKSQHLQIQVVPVPSKVVPQLEETFKDTAESIGLNMEDIPRHSDATHLAKSGMPFFYVELPSKVKLFHRIRKGFPLQFGREVLSSPPLLNLPNRVDWRECKSDVDTETNLRNRIRDLFKPYDFTLEDSDDED